ncbi:hypothetical protein M8J75_009652 [Diaphorina citri]|nr:hypothetical protein M8J75_009652 [Diaphorina citri]
MYKIRVYIVPESLKSRSISHQTLHEPYNLSPYDFGDLYSTLNSRTYSTNTLCDYTTGPDQQDVRNLSGANFSEDKFNAILYTGNMIELSVTSMLMMIRSQF